jgi:hypothetical protein
MKSQLKRICTLLVMMVPVGILAQITTLENGDRISWDGEYYDFRDSAGVKMIKLWVPPHTATVRGVFISGHGGGGGDSRNFARDENIRALAMRLGFAVAGLHNFPGRRVYSEGAPVFFHALDEFSRLGHHPELAHLPFVIYGSSNGGATTYGFVNYAPERAICFVANVSAGGSPEVPVDGALKVPGVFIMGQFDALIGDRGIKRTQELMDYARSRGALWSWAVEWKGHEDGASFDLYMKLVEQAVRVRYPEDGDPSRGPVLLKEIMEETGWLVDQDSWDSGLTLVSEFSDYKGDKTRAGWVLNKDMAFVYRSLATHLQPVSVSVVEFDPTFNPHTDPGTMFSLGGPVANPGDEITMVCDVSGITNWTDLAFYNGAEKLGEVHAPAAPSIRTVLNGNALVYCLSVIATDGDGHQWTSAPFHFFVRDPDRSWEVQPPKVVFTGTRSHAGSKNQGKSAMEAPFSLEDSILLSYALTSEQEAMFDANDGKISGFWSSLDESRDRIGLNTRQNSTEGSTFNFVRSHDCLLTVRSAYGADGIYLLFEVMDDDDVAWPNVFAGTENQQFYLHYDAVDVLMDSRSMAEICRPGNEGYFFSRGFGITMTSTQYQVACGTEKERPEGFIRSRPEPWDMYARYYTFEEAKTRLGIEMEMLKTGYFNKAQEWFIPWSEVGAGFDGEPDAGTRLGFTAGFNDRDKGEHFPPGRTSSGGSVHASNGLRWIGRTDPWGSGPAGSTPPYAWGEIELGPKL